MKSNSFLLNMDKDQKSAFIRNNVANNPLYTAALKYFTKQGFAFHEERTQVFVSHNNSLATAQSFTLAIIPSFKTTNVAKDKNHRAISIVVFKSGNKDFVSATEVTVNHDPLEISDFKLYGIGADNKVQVLSTVQRADLQDRNIDAVVTKMKESTKGKKITRASGGIDLVDFDSIVKTAFKNILGDNFAAPLYPAGGVEKLMKESSMISKFSQAVAMRSASAAAKIPVCSCSSSCNGCTSTSTSTLEL